MASRFSLTVLSWLAPDDNGTEPVPLFSSLQQANNPGLILLTHKPLPLPALRAQGLGRFWHAPRRIHAQRALAAAARTRHHAPLEQHAARKNEKAVLRAVVHGDDDDIDGVRFIERRDLGIGMGALPEGDELAGFRRRGFGHAQDQPLAVQFGAAGAVVRAFRFRHGRLRQAQEGPWTGLHCALNSAAALAAHSASAWLANGLS